MKVKKAIELNRKGIDVPVHDGQPRFYKELTEEELTVLKLYRESDDADFYKFGFNNFRDARKFTSLTGEESILRTNENRDTIWYQSKAGKIQVVATVRSEA